MYRERQRWEAEILLGWEVVRPLLLFLTSSDFRPFHLISFCCTQYSLAQAILAARGLEFTSPFNTNRKQDGENREGLGDGVLGIHKLNKEEQRFSNNLRDHHWSPGSGKNKSVLVKKGQTGIRDLLCTWQKLLLQAHCRHWSRDNVLSASPRNCAKAVWEHGVQVRAGRLSQVPCGPLPDFFHFMLSNSHLRRHWKG